MTAASASRKSETKRYENATEPECAFFDQIERRGGGGSFRLWRQPMARVFPELCWKVPIEPARNLISPGKYFEKSVHPGLGVDGRGRHNAAP